MTKQNLTDLLEQFISENRKESITYKILDITSWGIYDFTNHYVVHICVGLDEIKIFHFMISVVSPSYMMDLFNAAKKEIRRILNERDIVENDDDDEFLRSF